MLDIKYLQYNFCFFFYVLELIENSWNHKYHWLSKEWYTICYNYHIFLVGNSVGKDEAPTRKQANRSPFLIKRLEISLKQKAAILLYEFC